MSDTGFPGAPRARAPDRDLRERVAVWSGSKGELLDEVLGYRDVITGSDQGRSFQAFYDFLLSPQRQAELTELLDRIQQLAAIDEKDPRMRRIHYDWLDAAEPDRHGGRAAGCPGRGAPPARMNPR